MTQQNKNLKIEDGGSRPVDAVVIPPFEDLKLCEKFGGWARVQVAFYDYLFVQAQEMCMSCWREIAMKDIMGGFKDGENFYEKSIKAIEGKWKSFSDAWNDFVKDMAV